EGTLDLQAGAMLVMEFYSKNVLLSTGTKKFELSLPNEKNTERLYELKDIHKGRRAFLIGNGPSLRIRDLDKLKNEITFASNRIFLAFDETDWRPTYYTVADHIVARNNKEEINSLKLKKIFATSVWDIFKTQKDVIFANRHTKEGEKVWDITKGIRAGYSIINFDLKLANWMGIREIYVIGIDFSFDDRSVRTGKIEQGNEVIVSVGEQNHFHKDYRKAGETWTIPRLDKLREDFQVAKEMVESVGGKIFNASRQTKLDVWERVDLDEVLAQTSPRPGIRHLKKAMVYCADIAGHRHLYSAYAIRFFLEQGYDVSFCYAGKVSRIRPSGKMEYIPGESLYLDIFNDQKRLETRDICRRLNSAPNESEVIHDLQAEIKPDLTFFIDGDSLKWIFWKQVLPWRPRLAGRNYCIICLSEFIYYPRKNKLTPLVELAGLVKRLFSNRLDLVAARYFVEKFPLLNKFFFRCLCRYKLVNKAFCLDAGLVETFNNQRLIFLPELVTGNLEVKVDKQKAAFNKKTKRQYSDFLGKHKDKYVLLMFGDLEPRKGYDLLLRLAAHEPDCVCVRFGRTKQNYSPTWNAIVAKEQLVLEGRIFELDLYQDSPEFTDFIFSTVSFMVLPYKQYYRSSAVMIDVLRRGLPVLTHHRGVMARLIKKYGVGAIFKEGSFQNLPKAFSDFKKNYNSYAANIKKFNSDFSKESCDDALSKMLEP
ncbi:MAG: DUF115 domain-containing protein, partial [bacterium]|nr:DUF115 domain-containing protein [bacterium]